MARASGRTGETFGIGSLYPGRAEGTMSRFALRSTPTASRGSLSRIDDRRGARRNRRHNADPVADAGGAVPTPAPDHMRHSFRHARQPRGGKNAAYDRE